MLILRDLQFSVYKNIINESDDSSYCECDAFISYACVQILY